MDYRFYLLDESDRVRAGEHFAAPDDAIATQLAAWVHKTCSDVFDGYEVWRGTTRVAARNEIDFETPTVRAVIEQRQASVCDLEERLQRTFACVRQSKRLLEATARLTGSK